jgi:hypothetical protein
MRTTLTPQDLRTIWDIVAARLVENRRLSIHDLFFETLDEVARIKAQLESADPFLFSVGTTRWQARTLPDGGLQLDGTLDAAGRR